MIRFIVTLLRAALGTAALIVAVVLLVLGFAFGLPGVLLSAAATCLAGAAKRLAEEANRLFKV